MGCATAKQQHTTVTTPTPLATAGPPPVAASDAAASATTPECAASANSPRAAGSDASTASCGAKLVSSSGASNSDAASIGAFSVTEKLAPLADPKELDVMVTRFLCQDTSSRHGTETIWGVQAGFGTKPVEASVFVDAMVSERSSGPQVSISTRPEHQEPHSARALRRAGPCENRQCNWPLDGFIEGLGEEGRFLVRMPDFAEFVDQEWFPAVVVERRESGNYRVRAIIEDAEGGNVQEFEHPSIKPSDICYAGTLQGIRVLGKNLTLTVPPSNPMAASVGIDGADRDLCLSSLAYPSTCRSLVLKVAQDPTQLTSTAGPEEIAQFLSCRALAGRTKEPQRRRRCWPLHLGPYAKHKVEIQKKYSESRVISLIIDGRMFVEARAEEMDLYGHASAWECSFRIVAKRDLEFEVPQVNVEGVALPVRIPITQAHKFALNCKVVIPDVNNFSTAKLSVDGEDFGNLGVFTQPLANAALATTVSAFEQTFGFEVPRAMGPELTRKFVSANPYIPSEEELAEARGHRSRTAGTATQVTTLRTMACMVLDAEEDFPQMCYFPVFSFFACRGGGTGCEQEAEIIEERGTPGAGYRGQ